MRGVAPVPLLRAAFAPLSPLLLGFFHLPPPLPGVSIGSLRASGDTISRDQCENSPHGQTLIWFTTTPPPNHYSVGIKRACVTQAGRTGLRHGLAALDRTWAWTGLPTPIPHLPLPTRTISSWLRRIPASVYQRYLKLFPLSLLRGAKQAFIHRLLPLRWRVNRLAKFRRRRTPGHWVQCIRPDYRRLSLLCGCRRTLRHTVSTCRTRRLFH